MHPGDSLDSGLRVLTIRDHFEVTILYGWELFVLVLFFELESYYVAQAGLKLTM